MAKAKVIKNIQAKEIAKPSSNKLVNIENKKEKEKEKKTTKNSPSSVEDEKKLKPKSIKKNEKPEVLIEKENTKITAKLKVDTSVKLTFQLKYSTNYGQQIFIIGNNEILGDNDLNKALPLEYFNNEYWYVNVNLDKSTDLFTYNYFIKNNDGTIQFDCGQNKQINVSKIKTEEVLFVDAWNFAGYVQNTFYTEPFANILFNRKSDEFTEAKKYTHKFSVKYPLLEEDKTIALLGNTKSLGNWQNENAIKMHYNSLTKSYEVTLDLSKTDFPISYKYAVVDKKDPTTLTFENGDNRLLYDTIKPNKQTIINDVFVNLPVKNWRGAGIAIPVFGLKTNESFGVGEFSDLKALANYCSKIGLKLIQILPINDTTANHTWQDSYPYAAISAFALHPIYINLKELTLPKNIALLNKLESKRQELNAKNAVDYEAVLNTKTEYLKEIYKLQAKETFELSSYKDFFSSNKHWLVPYSCFCYLRDEYKTPNYNEWPAYRNYNEKDIEELTDKNSDAFDDIAFHYFVQYHLHIQLLNATNYAHDKGLIVKGDIPIGIFRFGADAWQEPHLYNMNVQAGAPPDDFAIKGQNWGFPTYNWQIMKEDGFAWWRKRFEQMSNYFDAFRIDHILGFFRIWSIPTHAVEGIMGYFVPAIPVYLNEFFEKGVYFNHYRYTKPFINDDVLWEVFSYDNEYVKQNFVDYDGFGSYNLKNEFATQKQVEKYFENKEQNSFNEKIKQGLYDLITNVILFEVEGSQGQQFHFRFGIENTLSFKYLDENTKYILKELYVNYFFKRQDDFWMKEALQKLPQLRQVTNMLICGEDLGLVPACVPDVMQQLGFLSLEIQRMPKDSSREFFHPNDAPYLSVVTPSTHDMSIIRGWWEEDTTKTQRFFNNELGQWGSAPFYCSGWINKAIIIQHLYSPAMWAIFQLQDLLGMDENLRRENPNDERINIPANPKHYWQYRMNISIEDLETKEEFNKMLKDSIAMSGR